MFGKLFFLPIFALLAFIVRLLDYLLVFLHNNCACEIRSWNVVAVFLEIYFYNKRRCPATDRSHKWKKQIIVFCLFVYLCFAD